MRYQRERKEKEKKHTAGREREKMKGNSSHSRSSQFKCDSRVWTSELGYLSLSTYRQQVMRQGNKKKITPRKKVRWTGRLLSNDCHSWGDFLSLHTSHSNSNSMSPVCTDCTASVLNDLHGNHYHWRIAISLFLLSAHFICLSLLLVLTPERPPNWCHYSRINKNASHRERERERRGK